MIGRMIAIMIIATSTVITIVTTGTSAARSRSSVFLLAAGLTLPEPDVAEQRRVLEMQCSLCVEIGDADRVLQIMRTFGIKFARMHPQHFPVRNAFAATRTLDEWRAVIDQWYQPV